MGKKSQFHELEINNSRYIDALGLISKIANKEKYLVLGSIATLSYTQKVGYRRQIHDIDVIMDGGEVLIVKNKLLNAGYELKTFIDKRMPFYKSLIKQAESHYLRFTKNEVAIEILSTHFIKVDNTLRFDLYPNLWVQIPQKSVIEQKLENKKYTTLELNLIYAIKQFLNNTLGRVMKYKQEQREEDLKALKKLVNIKESKQLLCSCKLGFLKLGFKIPSWII